MPVAFVLILVAFVEILATFVAISDTLSAMLDVFVAIFCALTTILLVLVLIEVSKARPLIDKAFDPDALVTIPFVPISIKISLSKSTDPPPLFPPKSKSCIVTILST